MAPGPTTTATITPPRSSHGIRDSWGYSESHKDAFDLDADPPPSNHTNHANHVNHVNHDDAHRPHLNGNSNSYHSGTELASRKMNSLDGRGARLDHTTELKPSPSLDDGTWSYSHRNGDDRKRGSVAVSEPEDDSKWIHRDKLAKIESQELQAAGIFIPRTRAPSKQRRERSRSAMRRGTDASEHSHNPRSRKNSTHESRPENVVNSWDIRTPEEIAEEEANAYFASKPAAAKGGSRIPVPKASPAPMTDTFPPGVRKITDSPEDEPLTNVKTRSRSTSIKGSDAASISGIPAAKRSVTDVSPKKAPRKTSGSRPPTTATGRPKTRSGSNRESNGSISTRPSTRSGELNVKAPEGDPPWMINSYKPDPRLPPDQQLLPTVARRLQQEKWEKEGKFGDVYDKEFRPLNDHSLMPPEATELEKQTTGDEQHVEDEWPLRLEPAKSPTRLGSSYSTMPKIQDTPHTPLASPRTPVTPHTPQHDTTPQSAPKPVVERKPEPVDDDKGGCGCCVVM